VEGHIFDDIFEKNHAKMKLFIQTKKTRHVMETHPVDNFGYSFISLIDKANMKNTTTELPQVIFSFFHLHNEDS
jgi:hypothetical protein